MNSQHVLSFLGRKFPVISNKIKNPSERHLLRIGGERVAEMAGTFQVYYLKEAPEPLSSIDMEVSIFINTLANLFKVHHGELNPNEVWIYYGGR